MANFVHQKDLENKGSNRIFSQIEKNRTFRFILLSLALHAMTMLALSHRWTKAPVARVSAQKENTVDVEVVRLSKQEIEKLTRQVVETSQVKPSEKAVEDAFLGAQTQVVNRQTKAASTAPFREGKKGGARGENEKVRLSELGVKMNYKPMGHLGPGEVAATSDHLKDVKNGAQTLLNTKEFAYYSFYQRVRKQLEQYWEPGLKRKLKGMFDRGRRLAADQQHSTRVMVVMDASGVITRILVEATSGLLDLDEAAIEAFNKAGPFPNPPQGLVEHDGTVKVEWEFVLKT